MIVSAATALEIREFNSDIDPTEYVAAAVAPAAKTSKQTTGAERLDITPIKWRKNGGPSLKLCGKALRFCGRRTP
jgi:hypothetical protein